MQAHQLGEQVLGLDFEAPGAELLMVLKPGAATGKPHEVDVLLQRAGDTVELIDYFINYSHRVVLRNATPMVEGKKTT